MPATLPAKSLSVTPPAAEIKPPPTSLACLRCQLTGRRNLICSREAACKELPLVFPLGPVLLALWLATAVAFIVAIWSR